jgi:hypothetical protein
VTADRTLVLYLAGYGRSGSTLLECLLSRVPGVAALGEVEHLWRRGVLDDQLCACGQPFSGCPFWSEVGRVAFGGWDRVDTDRVLQLKATVVRQRQLPRIAARHPGPEVAAALAEFTGYHAAIYAAARELTGAEVVVDSSKFPPLALALAHDPRVDLRTVHIVRDVRGVAFSWSKTVSRPETGGSEEMPRYSPAHSSVHWLSHNLAVGLVARLGSPVCRVRYEDLVEAPAAEVARLWAALDLPGEGELPMTSAHTIDLVPTHSVAGNPMRFRTGPTELRSDDAWRTGMGRRDRAIVTALCLPLLGRYGYLAGARW